MDHNAAISWPEQLSEDSLMAAANDDEFSNFLEFGITFPDFEGQGPPTSQPPRSLPSHSDAQISQALGANDSTSQASQYATIVSNIAVNFSTTTPTSAAMHQSYPAQDQQQQALFRHRVHKQQPAQHVTNMNYVHGQTVIPPTPNSVELHGSAAQYPQRPNSGHDIYDRYGQMADDQAAFYTPLVSPAVTPLETQFRLPPEYTIPGEYFTPLTSPALEAQHGSSSYPFQTTQPPTTSAGFLQSPIDPVNHPSSTPSSPSVFRKHRRRTSTITRAGGRAAKASPSIQARSRRKLAVNTQHLSENDVAQTTPQDSTSNRPVTAGVNALRYSDSSGQDSVSPEPISEPLMPPPSLPQTRKSPAIQPQDTVSKNGAPATPATLMRLQNQKHVQDSSGQFSGQASLVAERDDEPMEDVVLPEPVTEIRPTIPRSDPVVNAKDLSSTSAKSTPTIRARSSADRPRSRSTTPNLKVTTMASPSGPIPKKQETKPATSTSRKRPNVSSSHVSPALRPRISPNIQPLVRGESGLQTDPSTLYYGSKSNYQHILDGTLLPGVSYPETLAENLSSKRTNHKLAEQGRRNRINTALKEIESLLPPGFAQERANKDKHDGKNGNATNSNDKPGEKEKDKSGTQAISKASTVEMAIDYIKALQKELAETKAQLKAVESKLPCANPSSDITASDGKPRE